MSEAIEKYILEEIRYLKNENSRLKGENESLREENERLRDKGEVRFVIYPFREAPKDKEYSVRCKVGNGFSLWLDDPTEG